MLRSLVVTALVGATMLTTSAFAQGVDARSEAGRLLYEQCVAEPDMAAEANASAQCQCSADVVLDGWSERELVMFARVFAHYPDRAAARTELEGMIANEGYTHADYQAVGARLNQGANFVGDHCKDAGATQ